jgi:predicted nucleic acid-binding protein
VLSVITEAELLVGPLKARDDTAARAIGALLDGPAGFEVVSVSREIARNAAALRAAHGLGLADAIVAATALASGCTALMGNDTTLRRLSDQLTYLHLDELTDG